MTENPNPVPEWVDGKKINEVLFCREFLEEHPMVSVGGAFFTVEGLVSDENLLKKQIYDKIKYHITTGLWKKGVESGRSAPDGVLCGYAAAV